MNKSGADESAVRTQTKKIMAKIPPVYRARLERHIKIAVGLLPEKKPVSVLVKTGKSLPRAWPRRQARPFSSNGAQALRR